jgi:hypothetical protein
VITDVVHPWRHGFRAAVLAVALLMGGLAPAAADCRDDLAAVEKSFEETMARLESVKDGTQAQKCVAYRSHVEIMTRARDVFQRCQSGTTQRENVGQMNDSIGDFMEIIRRRCG